ncbi:peptidoglycan-binding domain-containing protein, partial [Marinococcus luteus]|uniref:peptidoglycan-binding domain-containing protein n=1 Tax=Marinococcus luteus TaxID=1122204 RepID=UPI002ACCCD24
MFKNLIFALAGLLLVFSFVLSSPSSVNAASNIVKYGDKSVEAQELKEDLYEIGYLDIAEPNQYFGSKTEKAVKEFQRAHSLTVDGVAGQNTFSKLAEVIHKNSSSSSDDSNESDPDDSSVLKDGVRSPAAQAMKEDLYELGYLDIAEPNENFGSQTEAAVKAFQRDHDLYVDGVAGPNTLAKLGEVMQNPPSNDDSSSEDSTDSDSGDSGVLKDGVRSPAAQAMKEDLYELGYLDIAEPNENFGSQTEAAVKAFQRDHDLYVDGVAGPNTLAKLGEVMQNPPSNDDSSSEDSTDSDSGDSGVLKDGVRSPEAQALKEKLYDLGY